MRVLVMGAAGFVGRPVLELLESRHEVTGFDVRPACTELSGSYTPLAVPCLRDICPQLSWPMICIR